MDDHADLVDLTDRWARAEADLDRACAACSEADSIRRDAGEHLAALNRELAARLLAAGYSRPRAFARAGRAWWTRQGTVDHVELDPPARD